ncbi:MAG TPA: NAD-dependent epimerase/dehydratase family protein, partial [Ilumatobacteraceae bacterium]
MRVAITGSSGLVGTALRERLASAGHEVIPVVRRAAAPGEVQWDPERGTIGDGAFDGIDAVVNLAGVGIADKRWTPEHKAAIRSSRMRATTLVSETIAATSNGPKVLLSGSAIGCYGSRADEVLDERSTLGDDFLAGVTKDWEASTAAASAAGVRVAHLRTGIVLSAKGGALKKQLPLFRLGLGGRF